MSAPLLERKNVYFLTLPSLLVLQFSIIFILVSVLFLLLSVIHQYVPSYTVCNFQWSRVLNSVEDGRYKVTKFAHACKICSHAPRIPMPRQADKEAAQVAMRLFGLGRKF